VSEQGGMTIEQIERVFGALSRIETKIDSHVDHMEAHVANDQTVHTALYARVESLQLAHARQKGFFSALAAGGSAIGAAIGFVIEKYWVGHN
jgi:hypothetical protein